MFVSPKEKYLNADVERKSPKNQEIRLTGMQNASLEKPKYTVPKAFFLANPSHAAVRAVAASSLQGVFRRLQAIHLDSVAFCHRKILRP